MDGGVAQYNPRTVEEVFRDYKARRAALIKALTTDVEEFFQQCDPEKENLCLYGHPNEQWEVNLPSEEVPPEIPEPALGINFARDGMQEKDWKRLFSMINELPTVYEVMNGKRKARTENSNHSNNKSNTISKVKSSESQPKYPKGGHPKEEVEGLGEEDEHGETLCGACGENYAADEFWICCDVCERWFHGKCVKITPARAEHIKQYKCPSCSSNKRARPS